MRKITIFIALIIPFILSAQSQISDAKKKSQEAILDSYLTNCAEKYNYTIQMAQWQQCLDNGLQKDSTVARLWQQKAMPYFKARKYEIGMAFIDKAVALDSKEYQPYRAFIKCIFAKTYRDAIADFEDCKRKFGNQFVMDHTYDFYMALCYLQLNDYPKAEKLLSDYVDDIFRKRGEEWEHPTALFYLGIAKFEQHKWPEAIAEFDRALKIYNHFSDAKFYKGICLAMLGKGEECDNLLKESKADFDLGYTINEDNVVYEKYPYQRKQKD